MDLDYSKELDRINSLVSSQNTWRKKECINLIASENVTSPSVDNVYSSDFSHRYAEGDPRKRYYNGTKYIDELEEYATSLASDLFNSTHANLQPISGTVANFAAISMFTSPGDTVITNATTAGGHISHNQSGAAGILGTNVVNFPITEDGFHIDVDKAKKLIDKKWVGARSKLSLLLFGCSLYLFPQPVKELAEDAHNSGIRVVYDAAHILGLIAGKRFQDPLREGADVVTGSTHKTFFGPQGGIILSNIDDKEWKRCKSSVFPGVVSNHHLHRIPALAIAMLEHKAFGQDYADQVIRNAKIFAQSLSGEGFNVAAEKFGFTESHQVAVDVGKLGGGLSVANKLEENNIIVNKNLMPWETISFSTLSNPSGIRIGVQEMTRWGMKGDDFKELAKIFRGILIDGKLMKKEVGEFRSRFQKINYAFS